MIEFKTLAIVSGGGARASRSSSPRAATTIRTCTARFPRRGAGRPRASRRAGTGPNFTEFGCNQAYADAEHGLTYILQRRATATATAASAAATSASAATTTTTAAASAATSTSAATATSTTTTATSPDSLPCATRPRTAPRSREDEDPAGALLGRQHPPRSLQAIAGRPRRLAEPEAGRHQAQELPGQARRRPALTPPSRNWPPAHR